MASVSSIPGRVDCLRGCSNLSKHESWIWFVALVALGLQELLLLLLLALGLKLLLALLRVV